MKIARTLVHPIQSLTAIPFRGVKLSQVNNPPTVGSFLRLDHLVPLDNNHSKFLSDLAEPRLALEKDFGAIQKAEAQRPFHAGGDQPQLALDDIDDNDIIMTDDEELGDIELTDALQLPRLVYWQGGCPPPELFFPFIPPQARANILQQENNLDDDVSTTACSQVIPQSSTTPSAAIPEPVTKDEVVDYFENLDYNIANGTLPPNIAAEAGDSAPAPPATVRDEKSAVDPTQSGNDVVSQEDEPEPEPEPLRRSVDPASFTSSKLPQKADSANKVSPLYNAEPAASTKPKSAEPRLKKKVVSLKYVPERYHRFLEEAMDFSTQQEKPLLPNGEFDTLASCRLGQKRNKEERKRFSETRKNHPNVWEAIIGTMLQEGVGIDNMLLCHEGQDEDGNTIDLRPQVLDNQNWCADNWRFDNLSWYTLQDALLPPDCSREIHKAPKGDERLFHETIGYLKSHPEICVHLPHPRLGVAQGGGEPSDLP
ncbi:uncharacterized protein Z519_02432 [Cladophialophora bantiana CBS 173.52]|uniref:Uncharacterized protein n=1 Tax=Cladophialophora bantiana (strain ATCC 10958 / CBS 173.52 / CDC B-1940 / NIH 8579) TaxID=1442370 RepID=A0A0D2I1L0_CLAB1|nr:uncharacterized protein Z519_02432 [Cladophialophora bantiana CBS 173.52]KIW97040.1 hypothetical protein Z519_02432 [Cladophialophora bantiana CBS 173.52]